MSITSEAPAGAVEAVTAPARPCGPTRDPATGQFTRANPDAGKHWLYSERLPPELQHLRVEGRQFIEGAYVDEGDKPEHVPTRRRAQLQYRARLHRRLLQIDDAIELRGLFDKRGRLRVSWLAMLATLIDKARALDALLGLERRPRQLNVAEELAQFHSGKRRAR